MAPKAKKGKKAQDDWDEGLGEVADPIAQATAEAKEEAQDEEETGGGGLMAALRKSKDKRKKKGKATDDFLEGEDPEPVDTPPVDITAKAPVEASMDDEDVFGAPTKKKGKKQVEEPKDDDEDTSTVKTKAEKEREKKEKEKARKKAAAAAKKKSTPAPKVEEKVEVVETPPPPAEVPGKKKKLNPMLAALQKQQEDLRRQNEESARLAAEEKQRIEEEEKRAEEEEKRKAEQKAAKKERERKKIEEMKRAGTYKTDTQKKAEAQAKLRLQQMLESGSVVVAGVDGEPTKKHDRKRNPRKEAEERKAREAEEARVLEIRLKEEQAQKAAEEAEKAKQNALEQKDEESDELDDWEKMAEMSEDDGKASVSAAPQPTAQQEEDESEEDSEDESESDSDEETVAERQARERREAAKARREKELEDARAAASKDNLRAPIGTIMGHVDTGKTKLLDRIRQTSVQLGEAGGITQQIGCTFMSKEVLEKKIAIVNQDNAFEIKVPGFLCLDTPGHASFSNLRARGSSLCNIAVLVVDIVHGLEPQTLESMKMLRANKTPFVVALNKIDRLYGWKPISDNGFRDSLALQPKSVVAEFNDRLAKTKLAFAEQSFNSELYYLNNNMAKNLSIVPTSAITGEGIPDLLRLILLLTQERMTKQLAYLSSTEASVLEVKQLEGLGYTIDVIVSNGTLKEGDTFVIAGTEGPIKSQIRALLTPAELKELRLKSNYVHNKIVKAAIGVKIAAQGLEHAIAGSRLLVVKDPEDEDEIEELEDEVMADLAGLMSRVSKSNVGVFVAASTLGSLEALLDFLKESRIPVGNISIGPVSKRDVITASTMLDKNPDYAVMLLFDVSPSKEAAQMAEQMGLTIFEADIIYHLFDKWTAYQKKLLEEKKSQSKAFAVFPCVCRPVAVFNKTEPIVVGVDVVEGTLRIGTPLAVVRQNPTTKAKEIIDLGRVTSIERDHKQVPIVKKNQPSVAVKIETSNQPVYGRQVDEQDLLYSHISRRSIDTLKEFYRDEVTREDWQLVAKHLKGLFDIA